MKRKIYIFFLTLTALCVSVTVFAERRQVQIIHADAARSLKYGDGTINRLIGNVRLLHNGATMTCDSAYLYPDNRFEAFSRVIVHKDTLWLYGDYMDYQSANDIGKVRGKMVTLIDGGTRLRTQFIDFNTANNVAFFSKGGTIDDADNLLESDEGYYYSNQKLAIFNAKVEMRNVDYRIKSDSLHYYTNVDKANFFKQSYVFHDDIFSSFKHGYYNKMDDHFFMEDHVYMMSEKQESWSDSAHYYRAQGVGEMYNNVQLYDSSQNAMTLGDYAKLYEHEDYAFVTKQPVGVFFSANPKDDTMFLKADTLLVRRILNTDTLTMERDSMRKYMHAYHHVKFYHPEVQGSCDSLSYSAIDSLVEMFFDPVLWNKENQLTANKINIIQKNNQLNSMELDGAGFIASEDDSVKAFYNQIKGKIIVAHFADNELYKVDVFGNGQSVYFLRDKMKLSGVNTSSSTDMVIYIKNRKVQKINYLSNPISDILPPKDINVQELTLKGFAWQKQIRPQSRYEITTRSIRPSQREESNLIPQPTFPITQRIGEIKGGFLPPENLRKKK